MNNKFWNSILIVGLGSQLLSAIAGLLNIGLKKTGMPEIPWDTRIQSYMMFGFILLIYWEVTKEKE